MLWITDDDRPEASYRYAVSAVLHRSKSEHQDITIVDTPAFGKALLLDDNWQSCVADEFLYHEPLAHPALILHENPKRVAILGGGEGATLREVLRWRCVERVLMIDLDKEVVEACKRHLPEMHQGAFDDPRAEVQIRDATEWLENCTEKFDVVISDLSEPLEHGPAYRLFTQEYFEQVKRVLAAGGIFTLQAGAVAPHEIEVFARVTNTVAAVFECVKPYVSAIPSFTTPWGFLVASQRELGDLPSVDAIDDRLDAETTNQLRMLDGEAFHGLFCTAAHVRNAIKNERVVYTLSNPPRI